MKRLAIALALVFTLVFAAPAQAADVSTQPSATCLPGGRTLAGIYVTNNTDETIEFNWRTVVHENFKWGNGSFLEVTKGQDLKPGKTMFISEPFHNGRFSGRVWSDTFDTSFEQRSLRCR